MDGRWCGSTGSVAVSLTRSHSRRGAIGKARRLSGSKRPHRPHWRVLGAESLRKDDRHHVEACALAPVGSVPLRTGGNVAATSVAIPSACVASLRGSSRASNGAFACDASIRSARDRASRLLITRASKGRVVSRADASNDASRDVDAVI